MRPMAGENWETAADILRLAVQLVDGVQEGLARRGFADIRPAHGFAFVRISAGDARTSDVAEHLGITKQAAAQIVGHLVANGYVMRQPDLTDARAQLLLLTERGGIAQPRQKPPPKTPLTNGDLSWMHQLSLDSKPRWGRSPDQESCDLRGDPVDSIGHQLVSRNCRRSDRRRLALGPAVLSKTSCLPLTWIGFFGSDSLPTRLKLRCTQKSAASFDQGTCIGHALCCPMHWPAGGSLDSETAGYGPCPRRHPTMVLHRATLSRSREKAPGNLYIRPRPEPENAGQAPGPIHEARRPAFQWWRREHTNS